MLMDEVNAQFTAEIRMLSRWANNEGEEMDIQRLGDGGGGVNKENEVRVCYKEEPRIRE